MVSSLKTGVPVLGVAGSEAPDGGMGCDQVPGRLITGSIGIIATPDGWRGDQLAYETVKVFEEVATFKKLLVLYS